MAYDAELDDVRSILGDICASLAELRETHFIVALGDPMRVSVRVDLMVVMEQLAAVLIGLREQGNATLDLYEQGIEERILFAVHGEHVKVERRDLFGKPKPPTGVLDLPSAEVIESLSLLARTFVDVAKRRCPQRCTHPWFDEWSRALLAAANS